MVNRFRQVHVGTEPIGGGIIYLKPRVTKECILQNHIDSDTVTPVFTPSPGVLLPPELAVYIRKIGKR